MNRLTSSTSSAGNQEDNIGYDLMGNITTLNRYAANTLIDQLSYTYTAGANQLQSITDATTNNAGQVRGTATYAYDGNGNLTADNSKSITNIVYNLLNLPQSIAGKSTFYAYDAAGQKLNRLISTAKTDYISGIQYDGIAAASTISFIQTEEGRAIPNGATAYNYEYTLTDHLGNSRVNFDTGTGVARLVQTDNYYPFGMDIAIGTRPSPKNNYLYNKKELQENLGLYDYGARFYDPVIAKWTSVDPLAEKMRRFSPYVYGDDNPIRNIDPDGMETQGCCGFGFTFSPKQITFTQNLLKAVVNTIAAPLNLVSDLNMANSKNSETRAYFKQEAKKDFAATYVGVGSGLVVGKVVGIGAGIVGRSIGTNTGAISELGAISTTPRAPVTAEGIAKALEGSTMNTTQGGVSLPVVQRFVNMLEGGSEAPAIKVSGNVIVEGNHRYVAGRFFGQEPAQVPGTLSPSQASSVKPIQSTKVDPVDWGNK